MSTPFSPVGNSIILAYADDSTDVSTEVRGASAFLVYNPDAANVIVFNTGFTNGDVDAVVPTSGANGQGVVVGPNSTVLVTYPQHQYTAGSTFISVAGVTGTGNVYITPGVV
jgi:hypothetical protein